MHCIAIFMQGPQLSIALESMRDVGTMWGSVDDRGWALMRPQSCASGNVISRLGRSIGWSGHLGGRPVIGALTQKKAEDRSPLPLSIPGATQA